MNKDGKIIAFDIDGTWTLNPFMWHRFMLDAIMTGFQTIFVTGKKQPPEKLRTLLVPSDAIIIVADGIFKEKAALDAGYKVSIWIDDNPGTIQPATILTGDL